MAPENSPSEQLLSTSTDGKPRAAAILLQMP